ncbi:50S ribosomal protein L6 [Pararhodospirillum photometricum]|uniref:Large ribosomal subunit protein uL6 n=1 Tax=Pararhodospirillum photometricum DSM 122 TaxID=1150469 RepID=H6SSI4_PARPM|nr:50S ribosomal protein L6 [Pararhodospirillum photometricum]CCG07863.1 50S ribosomal protein L6 [Pararhodospirillum photometricum DSM 122]
MSRVGKYPVAVPQGVTVTVNDNVVVAKGKLGELRYEAAEEVVTSLEENQIWVKPRGETKTARMQWGTTRARINNMIIGVTAGFTRKLEMVGVGYKAAVQGSVLKLSLGYSHDIEYPIPADLKIVAPTPTSIEISGMDKQRVGQVASEIRGFRPPEPYKGKGVKYTGEWILRKEGKKK